MIRITTFRSVPDFAKGLVRDLRVRWALEEAGIPYDVRLIGLEDRESPVYRQEQPFGQVPVIEDGNLVLFETGAILLHIANKTDVLMPSDPQERERAISWMFAALNSVEPWVQNFIILDAFHAGEEWARLRRPGAEEFARKRVGCVSTWLGDKQYLEGDRFTLGDLLMVTVLRNLRHTGMVEEFPNLAAYKARCEARPAFQRAIAAQMALYDAAEAA